MKTLYCLGPEGSYSTIIAKKMYPELRLEIGESFFSVMNSVSDDKESIALLPIENSITSDVHENIDYLFSTQGLIIRAEGYLVINLNLIGLQGSRVEDITTVYSHPKALAQTSQFIEEHVLSAKEAKSTSEGRSIILDKNDLHCACIGSNELIGESQLAILAENIGNFQNNMTRFLALSHQDEIKITYDESMVKGSYIFTVKHKPGTLANLLTQLAAMKVNLTKIESRPLPGTEWEYAFLVDLEMNSSQMEEVSKILDINTDTNRNIGTYKKGSIYRS